MTKEKKIKNLQGEELFQFFKDATSKRGEPQTEIISYLGFSASFEKLENDDRIHFTFSTADVDSYGDTIQQDGWELKRYAKNNVILWGHDHRMPAIGVGEDVNTKENLNGMVRFAPKEIHPFAGMVKDLVMQKFIKAGSVGLNPLKWELIEEKRGGYSEIIGINFVQQELLEFSICNVPANPFALAEFSKEDGKEKTYSRPPLGGFEVFLQGANA